MHDAATVKEFYTSHSDEIMKKRFNAPEPLRRHAHRTQYDALLALVLPGASVADIGCGEGVIPLLLAEKGIASTGIDLSAPNIKAAQAEAAARNVTHLATFQEGDAEHTPFADKSVDVAISSHVLEHLPDFDQGARELTRIARKRIIVALPTCLNLAAASILGGDYGFWRFSKRSLVAFPWGILRILGNVFREGVQEGYAGEKELPHIWRYPWVVRRRLVRATGWKVVRYEASTLMMPYLTFLLPVIRFLERFRGAPLIRNIGYGSICVLEPPDSV